MKFYRWNKHYLGWGITAFAVIVASSLVFLMLTNMSTIMGAVGNFFSAIKPIIYGLIFAYLLAPVVEKFEKHVFKNLFKKHDRTYSQVVENRKKQGEEDPSDPEIEEKYSNLKLYIKNKPRRIVSITLTFVILLGIVVGIFFAIGPQLLMTLKTLVENIPNYIKTITEWINGLFQSYPEIGAEINNLISDAGTTLRTWLSTSIIPQMGDYLGTLTNGIMSVVGLLLNLIFGAVVAIYCLYSKELFAAQSKKVIYTIMKVKHANKVISSVRTLHRSFGNFITGTIIDSFVVGCITFVVATIANVPFSMLVAVIMGITNIIPYFGPFIGLVPCLFLIFMEEPFMCIVFAVIVIIISNLNGNIISPKIIGGSTGLTSFWVIFAILAGQGIFGFWGLIIGIPLFAVIYSALRTIISNKLVKKGLPSGSDKYTDIETINPDDLTAVSLSDTLAAEALERERKNAEKKALKREQREKLKSVFAEKTGEKSVKKEKISTKNKKK